MFEYLYIILITLGIILIITTLFLLITKKRKLTDASNYQKIDLQALNNLIETENNLVILDVRTKREHEMNNIPNSILIESYMIKKDVEKIIEDKSTPIVVYCASGGRSRASALTLLFLGYTKVYDFGSINNWK